MYRSIYNHLIYPAYHFFLGNDANAVIEELDGHDYLSRPAFENVVMQKRRSLLEHAAAHVPYYQEIFRRIESRTGFAWNDDQFGALPLLTKELIRENSKRLVSRILEGNRLDANSTSGSSGSPLHFFTDLRSKSYRKATVTRNRKWIGVRRGDPVVHLWGSPIDISKAAAIRGRIHSAITRELFLSAYQLREADMFAYARRMQKFKPVLLIGYPSLLQEFGAFCSKHGMAMTSIRAIICSAESLYQHQRQSINRFFNVPVYNRYGCREVGDIAHEAPGIDGLLVNADRIFVEILDENGAPCEAGQTGEIVVTDLDNYGMPLIRYRIGDRGVWQCPGDSGTGLPYPVLKCVDGRTLDVVITPDGNHVGGTFWTILFRQRPGIELFQVIQTERSGITVKFVRDSNILDVDSDYFARKIAETCGNEFQVTFVEVESIEPESTGKFRIVKSDVAAQNIDVTDDRGVSL